MCLEGLYGVVEAESLIELATILPITCRRIWPGIESLLQPDGARPGAALNDAILWLPGASTIHQHKHRQICFENLTLQLHTVPLATHISRLVQRTKVWQCHLQYPSQVGEKEQLQHRIVRYTMYAVPNK